MDMILQVVLSWLLAAVIIFIVSRLNVGLSVTGFVPALIAAAVIAIISAVFVWLLGALGIVVGSGLLGSIVSLIVAALVLMLAARFVPGLTVAGFTGALIAAVAIAVVTWLISWVLSLF